MIAIIDYGMGNLRSVEKAFERTGHAATITDDAAVLADATKLVLPGVGAFRDAIAALQVAATGRTDPRGHRRGQAVSRGSAWACNCCSIAASRTASTKVLASSPGDVVRFDVPPGLQSAAHGLEPVPHFRRRPPIFDGIDDGAHFYFVHSYYVVPRDESVVATRNRLPAAVLLEHLARQSLRHAVPPGEEPGRPGSAC